MGYITHISTSVSKLEESHFKLGVDIFTTTRNKLNYITQNKISINMKLLIISTFY